MLSLPLLTKEAQIIDCFLNTYDDQPICDLSIHQALCHAASVLSATFITAL
jgi:hypothetical protein